MLAACKYDSIQYIEIHDMIKSRKILTMCAFLIVWSVKIQSWIWSFLCLCNTKQLNIILPNHGKIHFSLMKFEFGFYLCRNMYNMQLSTTLKIQNASYWVFKKATKDMTRAVCSTLKNNKATFNKAIKRLRSAIAKFCYFQFSVIQIFYIFLHYFKFLTWE